MPARQPHAGSLYAPHVEETTMRYLMLALTGFALALFTGCGDETTDDSGATGDSGTSAIFVIDADRSLV